MTTVYFDLETGGLLPDSPNIQLAAVAVCDGQEIDSFNRLIQFDESDADKNALAMNHYDAQRWANEALPEVRVIRQFCAFLSLHKTVTLTSRHGQPYQVARLAGYNAAWFDGPRLNRMIDQYGFFPPWRRPTLDVLQIVMEKCDQRRLWPKNFKLSTVAEFLGVNVVDAHDALGDVRMTAQIHKAITEAI